MAHCQVIGDVIRFDGYDVARISSRFPATVRGRLEDALEGAIEVEGDEVKCECKHEAKCPMYRAEVGEAANVPEDWLKAIMKRATEKAAAGMVELSDLQRICSELKEESE